MSLIGTCWERPRYRGVYLLAWGIIHLAFAASIYTAVPAEPLVSQIIHLWVRPLFWSLYSALTGVVCIATAFRRSATTIPAFVMLSTLLVARGVGHLFAVALLGRWRELALMTVWFTITALHITVARWPNPPHTRISGGPVVLSETLAISLRDAMSELDERREVGEA